MIGVLNHELGPSHDGQWHCSQRLSIFPIRLILSVVFSEPQLNAGEAFGLFL
jgi:hypothetical protein